jgi:hypothetical protein
MQRERERDKLVYSHPANYSIFIMQLILVVDTHGSYTTENQEALELVHIKKVG